MVAMKKKQGWRWWRGKKVRFGEENIIDAVQCQQELEAKGGLGTDDRGNSPRTEDAVRYRTES